jgi:type VI secretion system secreted protein VgrG
MSSAEMKRVDGSVDVGGRRLTLVEVRGSEALSSLFSYDVVAEGPSPLPELDELVGAEAQLTIRSAGRARTITGYVERARVIARDDDSSELRVRLRPRAHAQTLGRDCYAWQDVSIVDLLRHRLSDVKMPVRYELRRSYQKSEYRSQYREDDWSFLCRSMEEEGIYHWFDHEDGQTVLVFSDDSRAADELVGGGALVFRFEGFSTEEEVVHDLGSTTRVTPHQFTVGGFDPARPRLEVRGGVGGGRLEVYDCAGGGPTSSDACTQRATIQREAAQSRRRVVSGKSNCIRLVPGRVVEIHGHPSARLGGRYLVTKVEVHAPHGHREGLVWFEAHEVDVVHRPEAVTPPAKQAGLQMGVVVGTPGLEVYPSENGQVRVQLHWDRTGARDHGSGTWMRVAQRGAPGSMLLPRIGWNVATFNEEGAVDAPSVLCRIHDADHPPAYSLPGNMTRVVFKTATTPGGGSFNEIHFEDRAGAQEMYIHASRDMSIYVQHQKQEFVGNDSVRTVGNRNELWVDGMQAEAIALNQVTTIGGNETLTVGGVRSKSVTANEVHTVGGSRKLKLGKSFSGTTGQNRTLAAPVMIDACLGNIDEQAKVSTTTVGGALVRVSAASIEERSKIATVETVGGARIEVAKASRSLDVRKDLIELVGALLKVQTNANFIDGAQDTSTWIVGGALTGEGDELVAEADEDVRIKCGASVLTVTKDEIRIEATKIDLSGAKIDAEGAMIEHNS